MMETLRFFGAAALFSSVLVAAGCGDDDPSPSGADAGDAGAPSDASLPPDATAGALVEVTLSSTVGVLLDELPDDGTRAAATTQLLDAGDAFWSARARAQARYTLYRLLFRHYFYERKGQLPLPPEAAWSIELAPGAATRVLIDGHDVLARRYVLRSALLSDPTSVEEADPILAEVGGRWEEPFVLPVDPELIFQRTGYACMDESEYPLNSVDGENAWMFFDQDCEVETATTASCHLTELPDEGCVEALEAHVGKVETQVAFERVPFDEARAASVRVGAVTHPGGADLSVLPEGLDDHRIIYRFVAPDSCAIAERCVGGSGWRRLLQFSASVHNVGGQPLHIGAVDYFLEDEMNPATAHNLYEYSACHDHYHFTHYGTFTYTTDTQFLGGKRAFCLESTSRYSNHEGSPLVTPYGRCTYQGIESGWGDDYQAGLECQWVDVTGVDTRSAAVTATLAFHSNPDGFLCEGDPIIDANGELTWERTAFTTEAGEPVDRIACQFVSGHETNNHGARPVTLPRAGHGLITEPCRRGQVGPLRDCGFRVDLPMGTCTPGQETSLAVEPAKGPTLFRVCEASSVLGSGTACVYRDRLAQTLVSTSTAITFTCPGARSVEEPGGLFTVYTADLIGGR